MDATAPAEASTALTHKEARLIVFGVLMPTFLGSLDTTVLAGALPTIGRELGEVHNLPWLITAYLVASTAAVPLYGKLADIHGRQFALRLSLFAYLAGSLICALAPNMLVLILGRALHGLGGGGLTSLGMIVLGDVAAPKERGRYYAYFSVVYTTAGACGPALGGFIADYLHWTVIFWINIPLGLIAVALTFTALRRLPRHERPHRLDIIGAVLVVLASVSFMLAVNQGGVRFAWTSPPILTLLAAAAVLGALFVWRLHAAAEPLIPIAILADRDAAIVIATNALGWGSIIGLNIFLPTYLQSVMGMSPTDAGVGLMVLMVALNIGAGTSGQIMGRVRHYKTVPIIGMIVAVGAVATLAWRANRVTVLEFEILMALFGLGFGPLPPLCTVVMQNSVAIHQFGTAVGTMNFVRNLFATILVAVFGAIVLSGGAALVPGAIGSGGSAGTDASEAALAFSRVFLAATASLVLAFVGLLLMAEKPLQTNIPGGSR
ncbi:MAG: MFS transporter [Rhizobiales bacterium]|nr:MFS transporter [Hyphomicrobiales bacterium]